MTLKKALLRGLLGIPLGVFISTTIGFVISLMYGKLMIISPASDNITPFRAYATQYIVSMIIGFAFAFASTIFEVDNWSIAKQTAIHFLLMSIVFFPCSAIVRWINLDFISIIVYILIFVIIYVLIWLTQYFTWKNRITKLNNKLQNK